MKRYGILLAWVAGTLFPAPIGAQERVPFTQRVQQAYESAQDLRMDFAQKTYVAVLEKEVRKAGQAQFKKPGKFRISYAGERGRNYLCDGKTLFVFETGDKQVQKFPVDDDSVPAEALSFVGGLGNLEKDFAVEEVDAKKEALLKKEKGGLRWLELTPKKKRSSIEWLVMGFDKQSALVQELFIYTESGNLSHYIFEKVEANVGLVDSVFDLKR